jgi:hypothetical protein
MPGPRPVLYLLLLGVMLVPLFPAGSAEPVDRSRPASVLASATVSDNPPTITVAWAPEPDAVGFRVFRKTVADVVWGEPVEALPGTATRFTDAAAESGVAYEYRIDKSFKLGESAAWGFGYVCAGIALPLVERRGTVVLIVDSTQAAPLAGEIARLTTDLIGDGWEVSRHDVSPTATPPQVKALIRADYEADPAKVRAVFLFGHVPVARSGWENPDGHPDHLYAWPADTYYGDMTGLWTDTILDNTNPATKETNSPGDGRFDQNQIPADVALEVGRVDFAALPAFAPLTETDLLRRYLDKDHAWRQAEAPAENRGFLNDHFKMNNFAFAQNGFRNFAALCGKDNVVTGEGWPTDSYLWGYGCGPGSYSNASGVAGTGWYAQNDPKMVFTMLFGSYFGDWAAPDALLRAPLAAPHGGLACCWAASPNYFFHHMGMGWEIGYGVRLSQNNQGLYVPPASHGGIRGVWASLMGDPTLRLHPVPPPSHVGARRGGAGLFTVSWTASPAPVLGYHVYRSAAGKPYVRINRELVVGTSFTDENRGRGARTYMVRAVVLQQSATGTYYNASQGAFAGAPGGSVF